MADYPRYAIYYTPDPDSGLHRFGSDLLGYDAYHGMDRPFPGDVASRVPDWRELTADPRKYGFHATLKAPFALTQGKTQAELIAACEFFADTVRQIPLINPVIDAIDGFIAVIPSEAATELDRLAADCVREFDPFRAPLTPQDRARRNPSKLTARQVGSLDRWGYPYVMEEFRFHMTLTGRIAATRRKTILAILQERFGALGLGALPIDRIVLFRQDNALSRFAIVTAHPLRSA